MTNEASRKGNDHQRGLLARALATLGEMLNIKPVAKSTMPPKRPLKRKLV